MVIPLWLVFSLPSRPCPAESFHIISRAISMNVQMVTVVYHCPRKKNISSQLPNKKGIQYPAISYIFLYTVLLLIPNYILPPLLVTQLYLDHIPRSKNDGFHAP